MTKLRLSLFSATAAATLVGAAAAYGLWAASPGARTARAEVGVRRALARGDWLATGRQIATLRSLDPERAALAEARLLIKRETGPQGLVKAQSLLLAAMRDPETRPQAQTRYAVLLLDRGGLAQRKPALEMLVQASEAGSRSARLALAENLEINEGDQRALARLYTRASRESPTAAQRLEELYAQGRLKPRSLNESTDLRRRYFELTQAAARRGEISAVYELASAYERGYGVERDIGLAEQWYREAARRGSNRARLRYAAYLRAHVKDPQAAKQAHAMLEQAAAEGSVQAIVELGHDFMFGRGVPRDPAAANARYYAAMQRGSASAKVALAQVYLGQPAGAGAQEALRLLGEAAEQNNSSASFRLYKIYSGGVPGVAADPVLAARYLQSAVDLGHSTAIEQAAIARAADPGDPQAFRWAIRAVDAGSDSIKLLLLLGDAYAAGDVVGRDPERALGFYRRAGARGSAQAVRAEARLYFSLGDPASRSLALRMLQKAAAGGETLAYVDLGRAYASGAGVPISAPTAVKYFAQGAAAGDPVAMVELGRSYATGYGVNRDDLQAAAEYRRAADLGDAQAMALLAYCYEHGLGLDRDPGQARGWLQRGTATGDSESAYWYALFLLNPENGAPNPGEARRLLTEASNKRFKPAIALLARL